MARRRSNLFFAAMGMVFLAVAVMGFGPSFLFPVFGGNLDFPLYVFFHAAVMFGWLVLFIAQALLASRGPSRAHRIMGQASLVLIAAIMVSAVTASITGFLRDLPQPVERLLDNIFFLQLWAFILTPLLYWLAYRARRRRPEHHMRYMTLLTFFLVEAAASRIDFLPGMQDDALFIYAQYFYLDLLLIPLVLFDWKTLGRISPATIRGCTLIFGYQIIAMIVWDSDGWIAASDGIDVFLRSFWPT
ncbi:MAG: hypothetical protein AAGE05_03250 [Pseudomonadota bacterium]